VPHPTGGIITDEDIQADLSRQDKSHRPCGRW
jgi:hypothetical protein